ncbi:Wzz/FepE/Etk N-terminal domain-containing protein [Ghiorsea bivora]|uniref:Wzz/FepE/Etk N-terminal domain-containing protein n=1 Tax=Ghiorsea bivora TaxID=1485545 RepID=UPI00056E2192|nr:Wzz/FepE/Etk N-terminal domain-containing protein [Ghiorsea bivora]
MRKQNEQTNAESPILDPRMLQAMYGMPYEEDEIDLLEYWQLIWKKRVFIFASAFLAAILAAGISLTMPNIYRAETLLAPVGGEESQGGLSSMLGGLGGIASLAGVSLGGSSSMEENIAVLKSREFIWGFVKDEKLMPILFADDWDAEKKQWIAEDPEDQPSLWDAWRLLVEGGILAVNVDKDSGLVRLSIDWEDPELATVWVTKLVTRINAYLREQAILQSEQKLKYLNDALAETQIAENRQALFELISAEQKQTMLANTQKDYVFRVIDSAVVPDEKIKPKRSIIVLLTGFVVGFLAVVFVFIQEGLRKRKEEDCKEEEQTRA